MPDRLKAYFALNAAHPRPVERVGSVLLAERPGWRIDRADPLGNVQTLAADLGSSPTVIGNLKTLLAKADAVGRVAGVGAEGIGTAFRIRGGDGRRMLTAGHVFAALLKEDATLFDTHPVPEDSYRAGEVRFGADGASDAIPIARWVLVHPLWDLAILELADDPPGSALDIGVPPTVPSADVAAGGQPSPPVVAVIGFPGIAAPAYGAIGVQAVGVRHLSAGLLRSVGTTPAAVPLSESHFLGRLLSDIAPEFRLTHDASTMNGHSGAPLFDVATGKVIGIHLAGSRMNALGKPDRISDWNDAIVLSEVLKESWLDNQVNGDGLATTGRLFSARIPDWRAPLGPAENGFAPKDSPFFAEISPDRPDSRDWDYVPVLADPLPKILPPALPAYNQGREASCAAFAVAMTIDRQLSRQGIRVSTRMLDRIARNYDEWVDDNRDGTSLRAVIKGFHQNGVCPESFQGAAYTPGDANFLLTRGIARKAREISLGAYFRVGPSISHMQMAVQETGSVAVSAQIHEGWLKPSKGVIGGSAKVRASPVGMHAFAVVGYTPKGFLVQNSWGATWGGYEGLSGVALWDYADWWNSVRDAWVLRVAASAPAAFELPEREPKGLPRPRRVSLVGHVAHVEADEIVTVGSLGLGLRSVCETADYLRSERGERRYGTLALIFHDPTMGADAIERLVAHTTPALKAARIYPFHIAYGVDEIRTLVLRVEAEALAAQKAFEKSGSAPGDYIVRRVAPVVRSQIGLYESGARRAAEFGSLWKVVAALTNARSWPALAVISAGAGVIPADACLASDAARRAEDDAPLLDPLPFRLAIAPPVAPAAGATIWEVGRAGVEEAIPGYRGDWPDLLAVATGAAGAIRPVPDDGTRPATVAAALSDTARIVKTLRGMQSSSAKGRSGGKRGAPEPRSPSR